MLSEEEFNRWVLPICQLPKRKIGSWTNRSISKKSKYKKEPLGFRKGMLSLDNFAEWTTFQWKFNTVMAWELIWPRSAILRNNCFLTQSLVLKFTSSWKILIDLPRNTQLMFLTHQLWLENIRNFSTSLIQWLLRNIWNQP